MRLADWWLTQGWYYVLPNRLYWLLGANVIDSDGEAEWYDLLDTLGLAPPHWSQLRSRSPSNEGS